MFKSEKYFQKLPRPIVKFLRRAFLWLLDIKDRLEGKSEELLPPRSLHFIGGGDFKEIGDSFVRHFIRVAKLNPDEAVLDIGCGTGRMAVPLLNYLNPAGRYVGFDISEKAIAWCQRKITARNPNFEFFYADIHNQEYNPGGKLSAVAYRFPCADSSIDFAFATSVFTHMRRAEVMHYLEELHRVLKPTGRAMVSFFILDEEHTRLMQTGSAMLNFAHPLEAGYTIDPKTPERAIAYTVETVTSMIDNAGLHLKQPILFGSWSGRTSMLDAQDIVIVTRSIP